MPYIEPDVILEAKRMDLMTYLRNYEPYELVRFSGDTYTTKTHDSLKISNGKWMWWSRGIGGRNAIDYLIKVKGMSFLEAVETIIGHAAVQAPVYVQSRKREDASLLLPEKNSSTSRIGKYLSRRGIDHEIIIYCVEKGLIFESLPYHNVVFVGYDENERPKYAAYRSTTPERIMGDCSGSNKQYSFRLVNENDGEVHVFECAIDLLSYATLCKINRKDWKKHNLVSLAGVYLPRKEIKESKIPIALESFLKSRPDVHRIVLHLDNDKAGRYATKALQTVLPKSYEVIDDPPPQGKDFNDFLCLKRKAALRMERSWER